MAGTTISEPEVRRLFAARPAEHLRVMPGRETFQAELGAAGACVVKRSHGVGWRERLRERWHGRAPRSAGRHEFEVLEALARLSLSVPRALAWCEEADGRSLVVMERIEHTQTLRERAARASATERRTLATELLASVLRLHRAGWIHRDLYLQHFLVRDHDGALVLIDVGRARHSESTGRRWLVKDVAALAHSTPTVVSVRERWRFLARYLDGIGVRERAERRRFARDVEKKRALMAAHVPVSERVPPSRSVERRA